MKGLVQFGRGAEGDGWCETQRTRRVLSKGNGEGCVLSPGAAAGSAGARVAGQQSGCATSHRRAGWLARERLAHIGEGRSTASISFKGEEGRGVDTRVGEQRAGHAGGEHREQAGRARNVRAALTWMTAAPASMSAPITLASEPGATIVIVLPSFFTCTAGSREGRRGGPA